MTRAPFPGLDPQHLRRIALEMRAWLWAFAAWTLDLLGDGWMSRDLRMWVRAELKDAETEVRRLIVLLAIAKLVLPTRGRAPTRPRSVPPGFRRQAVLASFVRRTGAWIPRGRGDLCARLKAFARLLDDIDRHVARVLHQFSRGMLSGQLVPVAPPALRCAEVAGVAAFYADSS